MLTHHLVNGESQNTLSIEDRGVHYGDGVFETMVYFQGKILCRDEHFARFHEGCQRLGLAYINESIWDEDLARISITSERAIIKIILTRGQGQRGYFYLPDQQPTRILLVYNILYDYQSWLDGIHLYLCQFRYTKNPVLAGIKHLNRIEQILARSEWHDSNIQEGVVQDMDGYVIEGTMSNIFIIKNNCLFTADLSNCGISGIIRKKIIELSKNIKLKCSVTKLNLEQLFSADELFICNSIIGVIPVTHFVGHDYPVGVLTQRLRQYLIQQGHILSHES